MAGAREAERRLISVSTSRDSADSNPRAPHWPAWRLHPVAAGAEDPGLHQPSLYAARIDHRHMQGTEMAQRADAKGDGCHPLPFEPAKQGANFAATAFGHGMDQIVDLGLQRCGRKGCDLGGRKRCRIAELVKRDLFQKLTEIARLDGARKRRQIGHRRLGNHGKPRALQFGLDLVAPGRIVIKPRSKSMGMLFKQGFQRRFSGQAPSRDDDLRIPRSPVPQGRLEKRRKTIGRLFDQRDARARKEADLLDRRIQRRRILAQIRARKPRQPHLGRAIGADQRRHDLGPLHCDAHRIGPEDQQACAVRIGLCEVPVGLGSLQDHFSH